MPAALLSIDQLLRAAQLIEHKKLMIGGNGLSLDSTAFASANAFVDYKFGEDYKDRVLASKMRSVFLDNARNFTNICQPNSTGSSLRSSPLSVSSPNSPASSICSGSSVNTSPTTTSPAPPPSVSFSSSESYRSDNFKISASTRQSRAAHNELEKNRRANLRGYLESLKNALPNDPECNRDTTLSLLTRARNQIRSGKDQKMALIERRNALLAEHLRLRELLQQQQQQQPSCQAAANGSTDVFCGQPQKMSTTTQQVLTPSPVVTALESERATSSSFSTAAESVKSQQNASTSNRTVVAGASDRRPSIHLLYMNGLLPALPLLYPYTTNTLSANNSNNGNNLLAHNSIC